MIEVIASTVASTAAKESPLPTRAIKPFVPARPCAFSCAGGRARVGLGRLAPLLAQRRAATRWRWHTRGSARRHVRRIWRGVRRGRGRGYARPGARVRRRVGRGVLWHRREFNAVSAKGGALLIYSHQVLEHFLRHDAMAKEHHREHVHPTASGIVSGLAVR